MSDPTTPYCPVSYNQFRGPASQLTPRATATTIPPAVDEPSLIRTVNIMRDVLQSITFNTTINNIWPGPPPPIGVIKNGVHYPTWYQHTVTFTYGYVYNKKTTTSGGARITEVDKDQRASIGRVDAVEFFSTNDDSVFNWRYAKKLDSVTYGEPSGAAGEIFFEDFFERVINVRWAGATEFPPPSNISHKSEAINFRKFILSMWVKLPGTPTPGGGQLILFGDDDDPEYLSGVKVQISNEGSLSMRFVGAPAPSRVSVLREEWLIEDPIPYYYYTDYFLEPEEYEVGDIIPVGFGPNTYTRLYYHGYNILEEYEKHASVDDDKLSWRQHLSMSPRIGNLSPDKWHHILISGDFTSDSVVSTGYRYNDIGQLVIPTHMELTKCGKLYVAIDDKDVSPTEMVLRSNIQDVFFSVEAGTMERGSILPMIRLRNEDQPTEKPSGWRSAQWYHRSYDMSPPTSELTPETVEAFDIVIDGKKLQIPGTDILAENAIQYAHVQFFTDVSIDVEDVQARRMFISVTTKDGVNVGNPTKLSSIASKEGAISEAAFRLQKTPILYLDGGPTSFVVNHGSSGTFSTSGDPRRVTGPKDIPVDSGSSGGSSDDGTPDAGPPAGIMG